MERAQVQEMAEDRINELKEILSEETITPDSSVYIQLYEAAKSLYFVEKYELAIQISQCLILQLAKDNHCLKS